jgi:hypothetical protein
MINNTLKILIVLTISISCQAQILDDTKSTSVGVFRFSSQNKGVVDDLVKCCEQNLPKIAEVLNVKFNPKTIIEVYPDQKEYDNNIINKALTGSPAISGYGKIQMVSPSAPIKIPNIPYPDRLMFIVHEFVHTSIDQISPSMPTFLNEGLASYFGSNNFYRAVIEKYQDQLTLQPTIDLLINNYSKIPGVDVYSFLFIDFLVKTEGEQELLRTLKNHSSINSKNNDWIKYLDRLKLKK